MKPPTKEEEVSQIRDRLHNLQEARRRILYDEGELSDRLVILTGYCGGRCAGTKCGYCESQP